MTRRPNTAKPGPKKWANQLRMDMEFAKSMLFEKGEVRPMFILHTNKDAMIVLAGWPDNADNKRCVIIFS